jgi:hypothetical protein
MNPRVGATKLPEYRVWNQMRQRCDNPNNEKYPIYGARGIKVCKRWENFLLFIEDMGSRPSKFHTIERVDNSLGYEPSNCVWSTKKEQARNRRSNRIVRIGNKSACLQEWCDLIGVRHCNVLRSVRNGNQIDSVLIASAIRRGINLEP